MSQARGRPHPLPHGRGCARVPAHGVRSPPRVPGAPRLARVPERIRDREELRSRLRPRRARRGGARIRVVIYYEGNDDAKKNTALKLKKKGLAELVDKIGGIPHQSILLD